MTKDEMIEEVIKSEAPSDNQHDQAYRKELRRSFDMFQNSEDLEFQLNRARLRYSETGGNHTSTADCMVLAALMGKNSSIGEVE